jgi:hypothetical protein
VEPRPDRTGALVVAKQTTQRNFVLFGPRKIGLQATAAIPSETNIVPSPAGVNYYKQLIWINLARRLNALAMC